MEQDKQEKEKERLRTDKQVKFGGILTEANRIQPIQIAASLEPVGNSCG